MITTQFLRDGLYWEWRVCEIVNITRNTEQLYNSRHDTMFRKRSLGSIHLCPPGRMASLELSGTLSVIVSLTIARKDLICMYIN